jgi:hypothetical protein
MSSIKRAVLAVSFALALSGSVWAAPAVTLSPSGGPPTTKVTVTGTGFGSDAAIDIYFDTTDLCLALASDTGAFSCSIVVPRLVAAG